MPGETVSSLPVTRVPVTIGSTVAKGGLDTTSVDAVNRTTDPNEFVAVTRAIRYLPTTLALAIKPESNPVAVTGSGTGLLVVVLLPSCPALFAPQHSISPLYRTAQVCCCPADIEVATPFPETVTGVKLCRGHVLLLPS